MNCKLLERECTGCGECDRCDLHPEKLCDNCCQCLDAPDVDYASIPVRMTKEPRSLPRKRPGGRPAQE